MTDDAARRAARIAVSPIGSDALMERLLNWAASGATPPRLVCYLNAHNANLAFRDPEFAAILALADLAYADGMGVVWGWGLLGRPLPERVNAGDFIAEFCRRAAARGVSLYLLGGRPGVAAEAARRWTQAAPGLRVAGTRHGYFTAEEEPALAEAVRQAAPDILLVGMGAPRQEKWARRWAEPIGAPVVWCVGALFEYWGEARPRAPVWMRRGGLEWAWRLALEPRRLGRRYLIGNLEFLLNLRRLRRAIREEKAQAGDADGQGKGSP